jgi:hypothetical protein
MTIRGIGYWVTTGLLAFAALSGGLGQLAHAWGTLETVTILGSPPYFLTIIGAWKVLGAIVILAPGLPRIKEWAYAGIFFEVTGAAASHALAGDYGDGGFHLTVPLVLALLTVASWALRPSSRTLSALSPARTRSRLAAAHATA